MNTHDTEKYDNVQPIWEYRIGDYLYALWPNHLFLLSDHTHLIDVVHYKRKKFLFWKRKKPEVIAFFKIKAVTIKASTNEHKH